MLNGEKSVEIIEKSVEIIDPQHYLSMPEEAIEEHLHNLRARRETLQQHLVSTKRKASQLGRQELGARLLVKATQLAKIIDAINNNLVKADKKFHEIKALRLQYGDLSALTEQLSDAIIGGASDDEAETVGV